MYFLDALDKIKVESQNGKDKFILSQVAQIKLNNGMFVVDMNGSPEVFTLNIIKLFIFIPFTELSGNSYWTATFLPVTLGSGVLVCWSNRKWYHSIGTTRRRGGGQGDPNLSPPYFEFLAHIPFFFASSLKPFFNWKYHALLHNFPLFLPLPTLLELPPTTLFSPPPIPLPPPVTLSSHPAVLPQTTGAFHS